VNDTLPIIEGKRISMIIYKTLESTDLVTLHKAFIEAFSDYQVKMDLPLWKFELMQKRRGYHPKISMGAFKDGVLVGFVLNGQRLWNGKTTVYDLGTGVIPDYRKQGITSNILAKLNELLKEKKIEQYLLEVIQINTNAFNLYKKQGFEITRDFSCLFLSKDKHTPMLTHKVEHLDADRISPEIWDQFSQFWDFQPSWQNSIDSINAAPEIFKYSIVRLDGMIVGYGIVDKRSGDIPQLAVRKDYRHRGIGRSILADLFENIETSKVSMINVDDRAKEMKEFLIKTGFENSVNQFEMLLKL
jgi:ribosomal protein S18 acetylase RimI-like enzyme